MDKRTRSIVWQTPLGKGLYKVKLRDVKPSRSNKFALKVDRKNRSSKLALQ